MVIIRWSPVSLPAEQLGNVKADPVFVPCSFAHNSKVVIAVLHLKKKKSSAKQPAVRRVSRAFRSENKKEAALEVLSLSV